MRMIAKMTMLAAAAFSLAVASAYGNSFDFSYTFTGPAVSPTNFTVTGTFNGTQSGNLVTDISDVTLNFIGLGAPASIGGTIFAESISGSAYVDGGAVISIDGTQNNFAFFNSDVAAGDDSFTADFVSSPDSPYFGGYVHANDNPAPGTFGIGYFGDDPVANSSWFVVDPPSPSVPDSGATAAMLGISLLGLVHLRRKFQGRQKSARG
jgi:hypothetical protein